MESSNRNRRCNWTNFKSVWPIHKASGARMNNNMAREHYEAYKRMLLKLHELDAQGKGQTAEANKIRAEMELPERHLSPLEQERLDGLSGDLYMLVGEEVKEPADDTATPFAFRDLLRSKQWDDLLSIPINSTFARSNLYRRRPCRP